MLSFSDFEKDDTTQTFVATVEGGKNDKELLYLYDKEIKDEKRIDYDKIFEIIKPNKKKKMLSLLDIAIMKETMEKDNEYKNNNISA